MSEIRKIPCGFEHEQERMPPEEILKIVCQCPFRVGNLLCAHVDLHKEGLDTVAIDDFENKIRESGDELLIEKYDRLRNVKFYLDSLKRSIKNPEFALFLDIDQVIPEEYNRLRKHVGEILDILLRRGKIVDGFFERGERLNRGEAHRIDFLFIKSQEILGEDYDEIIMKLDQ